MGRLPWVVSVGPIYSQGFLKVEGEMGVKEENVATEANHREMQTSWLSR